MLQPFESVVRYRLGKVSVHGGRRRTSVFWINPLIDKTYTFDTRPAEIELTKQQLLTAEMVPASLSVTIRQQIFDPLRLVTSTKLFVQSDMLEFLQATLLNVVASTTLSELCGQRRLVGEKITERINAITFDWGIGYDVTLTKVDVPTDIAEAFKAEAEIVSKLCALEIARKIERESHRMEEKLAKAAYSLQGTPEASFSSWTKSENDLQLRSVNTLSPLYSPGFQDERLSD